MEVHAHCHPDPAGDNLGAAAIHVDTSNLRMGSRRHADVAGSTHLEIELVVGSDCQIFPTMGLVAREVAIDNDRFRRIVQIVFDVFDLRDFV